MANGKTHDLGCVARGRAAGEGEQTIRVYASTAIGENEDASGYVEEAYPATWSKLVERFGREMIAEYFKAHYDVVRAVKVRARIREVATDKGLMTADADKPRKRRGNNVKTVLEIDVA